MVSKEKKNRTREGIRVHHQHQIQRSKTRITHRLRSTLSRLQQSTHSTRRSFLFIFTQPTSSRQEKTSGFKIFPLKGLIPKGCIENYPSRRQIISLANIASCDHTDDHRHRDVEQVVTSVFPPCFTQSNVITLSGYSLFKYSFKECVREFPSQFSIACISTSIPLCATSCVSHAFSPHVHNRLLNSKTHHS